MEQTGAETPIRLVRTALHPREPSLPQSQTSEQSEQQHPARDAGEPGVRGEHVHSEPAAPAAAVAAPPPPAPVPQPAPAQAVAGPPQSKPPLPVRKPRLPHRHSVRAQVLTALREALLAGELVPGEVYSAPALADRFGVSATPVREAMQRLVCEGAVETVPNRGFRVAQCSARDLAELAEIRALLEVPSVLRVARSMPPECWEPLHPLAEDTLEAATRGDRAAYADADSAFHGALLELTGNRQLVAVAADIQRRSQVRPSPLAPAARTAELLDDASEHLALLEALQTRDLVAAERLMRAHVATTRLPVR